MREEPDLPVRAAGRAVDLCVGQGLFTQAETAPRKLGLCSQPKADRQQNAIVIGGVPNAQPHSDVHQT